MWLTPELFATADAMVSDLESDMVRVFERIGRTNDSANADKLLGFIRKNGPVRYDIALQHVYREFPKLRDFEAVLAGLINAKLVQVSQGKDGKMYLQGVFLAQ